MATADSRSAENLPALRHSVSEVREMAKAVAASRLFGMDEAQAMTMMLLAQAKGIHPIQAVERYHVISNRPAMKADAMLADFQAAGGTVKWVERTNTAWEGIFTHPVQAPEGVNIRFTIEDAKRAELLKNHMWSKYPANMLRARVISNGIRTVLPGIVAGIYTPEEVGDFDHHPPAIQANARVVETRAVESPRPNFNNGTGHATGKYASPESVKKYVAWLKAFNNEACQKWLDYWTGLHGELPNGIGDLINPWRLSHHLCKWAREENLISAPEDFKVAQTDRLVAILYERDPDAVLAEAKLYCRKLWAETKSDFEKGVVDHSDDPVDEDQDAGETAAGVVAVATDGAGDDSREG